MIQYIQQVWHRISRIGLTENEGVLDHRNVILINRIILIMVVLFFFYIPVELFVNGVKMIHVVVLMIISFVLPIVLNHFRLFNASRYYIFFIGSILILLAGLSVGKGINNHISYIPLMLLTVILFQKKYERIIMIILTVGFFFLQQYLFEVIEPSIDIPDGTKEIFSKVFFVLAILMSFFLAYYFIGINDEYELIIQQQKEEVESQNEIIQEKQKEILDSINYAKRIQQAILPPLKAFEEHIPQSFILYKPKDIVAGDFYWMEKIEDAILFAAADCTGHGVPGAMVSVVCNNGLNRSVREFGFSKPGEILDKTRTLVIEEFIKSEQEVKDGMDIALCSINGNRLSYAGANNPLWIIRKNSQEIEEIKATKEPIGNYQTPTSFTTHSIDVNEGDTLYVFTDGYADQFGGEGGKKFKAANFKKLLLSIQNEDMATQKVVIDQAFEDWKNDLEQVDDVCVIGVRF